MLFWGLQPQVSAQGSNEITVCAAGCDFTSINEAISSANSGDLINIGNGILPSDALIIDKSLTLRGQGINGTILRNTQQQETFLQINNAEIIQVFIDNLTLESGCAQPIPNCIGDGVTIQGRAILAMDEVRVLNHGGTGVRVGQSAQARVLNSSIFGNGGGVVIEDRGQVDLSFTSLDGNSRGIDVDGTLPAQLNLLNSSVSNNGTGIGVSADETNSTFQSSITLFNVQVGNNGQGGFVGGGNVSIKSSSLFLNGGSGIQFLGSGSLELFQNRIFLNTDHGVDLSCPGNASCARITENEIVRNGLVGLNAEPSMLIECRDNFIRDNSTDFSSFGVETQCT